jgi:protein PhnA
MNLEEQLKKRSNSCCEMCESKDDLAVHEVLPHHNKGKVDDFVYLCVKCKNQVEQIDEMDSNHWRCLNESMWSETPVVKVLSWRMLTRLKAENWTQDLLEMMYLDDETLKWAKSSGEGEELEKVEYHTDSNGARLESGDTVVLIKDLNVKGGGFTAKRGTAVRNITLVHDNPEHIEGKVNGQQIVILTKFVKK